MIRSGYLQPGDRPDFIESEQMLHPALRGDRLVNYTIQSLAYILDLARQAVDHRANSYRGFKVGTAVLAFDSIGGRVGKFVEGNYTPYKGAEWNCAEKRVEEKTQKRGYDRILAIAVAGPPYTDETTGVSAPTCQPCHRCRSLFERSQLFTGSTLVATTNIDESAFELHTVDTLKTLHETGQPQTFPDVDPLLPAYWQSIQDYDAAAERAEVEALQTIAAQR